MATTEQNYPKLFIAEIEFDDITASVSQRDTYFGVLDRLNASGIGHDNTGTSTMFFRSHEVTSQKQLESILEDIPVLSIREI